MMSFHALFSSLFDARPRRPCRVLQYLRFLINARHFCRDIARIDINFRQNNNVPALKNSFSRSAFARNHLVSLRTVAREKERVGNSEIVLPEMRESAFSLFTAKRDNSADDGTPRPEARYRT